MQLPFRPPFAHANFQLGRKGQRPKGRKVKGQNFKKLAEAILTLFQALCIGFTSFLVLKMVIVEDLVVSVHCAKAAVAFKGKFSVCEPILIFLAISYLYTNFEQNRSINAKFTFKGQCGLCLAIDCKGHATKHQ